MGYCYLPLLCLVFGHVVGRAAESADAPGLLHVGDKIQYRVLEDPDKVAEPMVLIVNSQGDLSFPIAVRASTRVSVKALDRGLEEVRQELKAKLDADYYQNATVEVRLMERTQKVGQVFIYGRGVRNNGGVINLTPGDRKTILEAVLQAGPTDFANLKKVRLLRYNPKTEKTEETVVDVDAIKRTGDREKNVILRDKDQISVEERGISF